MKKITVLLTLGLLLTTQQSYAAAAGEELRTDVKRRFGALTLEEEASKNEAAEAFLKEVFTNLFDPESDSTTTVKKYMTDDYVQHVDGKTLDYDGFVTHLGVLLGTLEDVKITFENVIMSGNIISDIHIVDAMKKDGSRIKSKVIAFFFLREGKIYKIDELTHLIEGEAADEDLGSRT